MAPLSVLDLASTAQIALSRPSWRPFSYLLETLGTAEERRIGRDSNCVAPGHAQFGDINLKNGFSVRFPYAPAKTLVIY